MTIQANIIQELEKQIFNIQKERENLTVESCEYYGKTDSVSIEKDNEINALIDSKYLEVKKLVSKIQEELKKVTQVGFINHYPEMQKETPFFHIKAKLSYGGGYYLSSHLELKGRGIKLSGTGKDNRKGYKTYHVTKNAFNKLKTQYLIVNSILLS